LPTPGPRPSFHVVQSNVSYLGLFLLKGLPWML
jgi:hypothetical protein